MKYSNKTMLAFYQQIGKIFYAVAAIDKTVSKEELSELKKMIRSEWIGLEDSYDEFGTDSAYQIEIVFDWLTESEWNVKHAIPDLKDFKKEHSGLFTKPVNELILKTASVIASSFSGKNKSELVLLDQLQNVLFKS